MWQLLERLAVHLMDAFQFLTLLLNLHFTTIQTSVVDKRKQQNNQNRNMTQDD